MRSTIAHSLITLFALATTGCLGNTGEGRKASGGTGSGGGRDDDESCDKLNKDITIRSAADMTALPKTGCYDIYGKLSIQGSGITSLAGLNQLNSVNHLELDHTGLATIDSPRQIGIYGELTVAGNAKLTTLDQLSFEIAPTGVKIDGNAALRSLEPFGLSEPKLERVDGDLAITGNAVLPSVALPYLTAVTGKFTISNNAVAKVLTTPKLATAGGVAIADNPQLTTLSGFAGREIAGDLTIRNNPLLNSLGAMSTLYRVAGNLTIDNNAALTNLSALSGILLIDRQLTISNNANLDNLGTLKRLQLIGALAITNNQKLLVCRAVELAECVRQPVAPTISGNRDIQCSWQC